MDERVKQKPEPSRNRASAEKMTFEPRRKSTAAEVVESDEAGARSRDEPEASGAVKAPPSTKASSKQPHEAAETATKDQPVKPASRRRGGRTVRAIFGEIWNGGRIEHLRQGLRRLYHGEGPAARRFQLSVMAIDVAIIAFFILSPLLPKGPIFYGIDYSVAFLLALDLGARALASRDVLVWSRQITTLVDLLILATMLFPYWLANFGFLRVLRIWTLSKSDVVWIPLRRSRRRAWEDPIRAVVSLVTFLFVVTGFVYTFFKHPQGVEADGKVIENYVDALYFTVATVTTTGFGDITLEGTAGKLTSVVVMIVGISLFVRLAQAIFRPAKVTYRCPNCALMKHDPDAVHCKACGEVLKIPDDGE